MTSNEPLDDPMLSAAEASRHLGVPITTLRSRRDIWGLTYYQVGRALKFRKSSLDEWLRSRKKTAAA
jgi:excisionase family DNA binding protein